MSERGASSKPVARWPYGLFVLSGLASLVFEAVFLRQLTWLFGSSARATALVLSAFMAGLALGAVLLGRLADRSVRPLRLFGLLELGAALCGSSLVWLLGSGRQLFLAPLRSIDAGAVRDGVELSLAFGLVLLPTVLMGGTLPALSRHTIRNLQGFLGSLGLLYGLNTLGAAVGVFLAGFYLFEWLGVSRSAYLAAAIQGTVGMAAILLDRLSGAVSSPEAERTGPFPARRDDASPGATRRSEPAPRAGAVRSACLVAASVGGFAVLGYEVLWTRLLSLMMRSFSYSFSLMLALFLVGLFAGSILVSFAARRTTRPVPLLGWIQVGMGLYVAATVLWLPDQLVPPAAGSFTGFLARSALRAAWVVVPPTILSGMVLPLAARGFAVRRETVGSDVGLVYGVNTGGAILGALLSGLYLLPALGAPNALVVLAAVNALAGVLVLSTRRPRGFQPVLAFGLAAACLLPLLAGSERFVQAFLRSSHGADKIGDLLFFHEGASDTVAIVRKKYGFLDPEAKSLITNGVAMSATVTPVLRYMTAEGHLPAWMSAGKNRALAVGVGTGITLGALVSHPGLRSITAVELSDGVLRGLDFFERENGGAHRDPRVDLVREDGRHFLELAATDYDLITLEPPPPVVAGSVHLYSLDFYRICSRRLRPGGVVAQWLPLHAQSLASARMTARTFVEEFAHVMLWLPSVRDAVLLGSHEPLRLDLRRLLESYSIPRTRANLFRALFETPEALLATFLLDRPAIAQWAAGAPVITDEHPLMEFFRHQGGNMGDPEIGTLLAAPQAAWDWIDGLESRPGLRGRIERENEALRLYVRRAVENDTSYGIAAAQLGAGTEFFRYPFGCTAAQIERFEAGSSPPNLRAHLQRCAQLTASGSASE